MLWEQKCFSSRFGRRNWRLSWKISCLELHRTIYSDSMNERGAGGMIFSIRDIIVENQSTIYELNEVYV